MNDIALFDEPEIVEAHERVIVGMMRVYPPDHSGGMAEQWEDFAPEIDMISARRNDTTYGLLLGDPETGDIGYLTGVEISDPEQCPPGLEVMIMPEGKYAVFVHNGHVEEIEQVWETIFTDWLPQHEYYVIDGPRAERYAKGFDPATGTGRIEIWVPIAD